MKKFLSMLLIAALVLSVSALSGCSTAKVIDFKEFTDVTCTGYNEYGYVTVNVDYDAIAAMLGDRNTFSAMATLNSIKVAEVENNGALSNGDIIKVKFKCSDNVLKEANLAVRNTELEFTVSGLAEKEVLDVFKDVDIMIEGYSPLCTVTAVYGGDIHSLTGTGLASSFHRTDANGENRLYYSNGETVTFTLTEAAQRSSDLSKYKIKEISKDYTVNCDTFYITKAADLSAE